RRHTRCLSDWSSDVCSSDLNDRAVDQALAGMLEIHGDAIADHRLHLADSPIGLAGMADANAGEEARGHRQSCVQARTEGRSRIEIGRASGRERVNVKV